MSTALSGVGVLMLIGACTVVLADYGRELIAVDRCLDDGGVYNYDAGRCRDDIIHLPHVPYTVRRKMFLASAGTLALCGAGLVLLGRRRR
jgi:hypothetical protein